MKYIGTTGFLFILTAAGCSAGAGMEKYSTTTRYFGEDGSRIFIAAKEALASYGQVKSVDEKMGTVSGVVGPYTVTMIVPPGTSKIEITCDVEGAWTAGAAKTKTKIEGSKVTISKEGLTAQSCVEDLQSETAKRF